MAINRYTRTAIILGGQQYATCRVVPIIYKGAQSGRLNTKQHVIKAGERLDVLAGRNYNDSSLWWVIAAASGIGWNLQVPPGVLLTIPVNISQVISLIG